MEVQRRALKPNATVGVNMMLGGEKVRLKALERNDLERCWKWINDPEVTYFLGASSMMLTSRAEEEK